jgi:Ni/Fe-hydrogenase subunit HybB-like protein
MHVLSPLAAMAPYLLGVYIVFRLGDMLYRGTYVFLFEASASSVMFWLEFGLLTLVPFFLFMARDIRRWPGAVLTAAAMYIVGVVLNR